MNKKIKNSFGLVVLLASVVFLNACSDPEEKPKNVITDADGITIDLTWTTGGDALADTDLDLFLYDEDEVEIDRGFTTNFETVYLSADQPNGTYTIAVKSYNKVNKATSYSVIVDGETPSNPYAFHSNYAKDDTFHEINVLTVTKAGTKYTVTPIN